MPEEQKKTSETEEGSKTEEQKKSLDSEKKTSEESKESKESKEDKEGHAEEKTYKESYVKGLTSENAKRRLHEQELEGKLKQYQDAEVEAETDLKKKNTLLTKKLTDAETEFKDKLTAADRRFIISEARRVASQAGIIDVDDIKTLNLADLRISDDDTVHGLDEMISELKKSKPHWFKSSETEGTDKNKTDKDKKKIVTPTRKDGEQGKDWGTADKKELRSELAKYGVMT